MPRHHDKANGIDATPKSTRKDRSLRSESPAVKFSPPRPDGRPKASPKRRLKKQKDKKAHEEAKASSVKLQEALADGAPSVADSIAETEEAEDEATQAIADIIATEEKIAEDAAEAVAAVAGDAEGLGLVDGQTTVTVTSEAQEDGDIDAIRTKVTVEMPANTENGETPENADEAIAAAKAIVEQAKSLQDGQVDGASSPKSSKKRKAEELEVENPEEELVTELVQGEEQEPIVNGEGSPSGASKQVQFGERMEEPPTKRTRVMVPADEFRKQKMQKRALVGLTATVAVGAIIPFVSSLF